MKRYLTDTNVLVAMSLSNAETIAFVDRCKEEPAQFFTTLQIVCEFWNVCTRPEENKGLGLSPEFTLRALDRLRLGFPVLPDTEGAHQELLLLLSQHKVRGRQIYDARLAAAVRAHKLDGILTYNLRDFARYGNINPFSPSAMPNA